MGGCWRKNRCNRRPAQHCCSGSAGRNRHRGGHEDFVFLKTIYIRYPEYDYVFHIFELRLCARPQVVLNPTEHKASMWASARSALRMPLVFGNDELRRHFFVREEVDLAERRPTVYTAHSKHYAFAKMHICKFVLDQGHVPLNPFNLWGYFLYDLVDRDVIRRANNTVVQTVDEVWVFGPIANGVWAEIELAIAHHKPLRFFDAATYAELPIEALQFEEELCSTRDIVALRDCIADYKKGEDRPRSA